MQPIIIEFGEHLHNRLKELLGLNGIRVSMTTNDFNLSVDGESFDLALGCQKKQTWEVDISSISNPALESRLELIFIVSDSSCNMPLVFPFFDCVFRCPLDSISLWFSRAEISDLKLKKTWVENDSPGISDGMFSTNGTFADYSTGIAFDTEQSVFRGFIALSVRSLFFQKRKRQEFLEYHTKVIRDVGGIKVQVE